MRCPARFGGIFKFEEAGRKEDVGLRIDLGRKEITNHSFPTKLNSIGHPCLKAKSPKHPHRLSLGARVSVRSRVTGSQLHLLINSAQLEKHISVHVAQGEEVGLILE